jgi:hypothetical protein
VASAPLGSERLVSVFDCIYIIFVQSSFEKHMVVIILVICKYKYKYKFERQGRRL